MLSVLSFDGYLSCYLHFSSTTDDHLFAVMFSLFFVEVTGSLGMWQAFGDGSFVVFAFELEAGLASSLLGFGVLQVLLLMALMTVTTCMLATSQ